MPVPSARRSAPPEPCLILADPTRLAEARTLADGVSFQVGSVRAIQSHVDLGLPTSRRSGILLLPAKSANETLFAQQLTVEAARSALLVVATPPPLVRCDMGIVSQPERTSHAASIRQAVLQSRARLLDFEGALFSTPWHLGCRGSHDGARSLMVALADASLAAVCPPRQLPAAQSPQLTRGISRLSSRLSAEGLGTVGEGSASSWAPGSASSSAPGSLDSKRAERVAICMAGWLGAAAAISDGGKGMRDQLVTPLAGDVLLQLRVENVETECSAAGPAVAAGHPPIRSSPPTLAPERIDFGQMEGGHRCARAVQSHLHALMPSVARLRLEASPSLAEQVRMRHVASGTRHVARGTQHAARGTWHVACGTRRGSNSCEAPQFVPSFI